MTDDELIIRHVRLCECGKVAGHNSICLPGRQTAGLDPEREVQRMDVLARVGASIPSAEIDDPAAERRAERHARRQPGFRADRHQERAHLSNQQLQALADIRAAKLSPIAAGNIAPSHGSAGHPSANLALRAGSIDLNQDPRWRGADSAERRALERKHDLLDEYEGLGTAGADPDLTPEAKDAAIVAPENEHLTSAEFSRQFPGYGTPATVARKRRWHRNGMCTMNGLPPRSGCHCPTCRGVIG